jgi:hypothetical protein
MLSPRLILCFAIVIPFRPKLSCRVLVHGCRGILIDLFLVVLRDYSRSTFRKQLLEFSRV